jgi:hypothetical protein
MVGGLRWASWELLQDVEAFQSFVVSDLLAMGQRILEDSLLATGTGTAQPLGRIWQHRGTGTGSAYALVGEPQEDSRTVPRCSTLCLM